MSDEKVIQLDDYREEEVDPEKYFKDGEPTVRALWEKIRKDMMMGVTFWDYTTKIELKSPMEVLEHFIMHIDLQIRAPLDEDGEPVTMCDARKRGEQCPLCEETEGKIE